MRTIDIKKNDANQRLDKFLSKRFKTMPKSLMYKYIRTKYIKLNGKKCDIKDMLKEGDVLTLYIKDEFFEESEQENYEFLKAPDKLDIVYEDGNIILIDKKPGIIVIRTRVTILIRLWQEFSTTFIIRANTTQKKKKHSLPHLQTELTETRAV